MSDSETKRGMPVLDLDCMNIRDYEIHKGYGEICAYYELKLCKVLLMTAIQKDYECQVH